MSTVRDLIEEAKKRIVILIICVVGLSYLMSLTSSSVLVNLPAAALLIIVLRYLSLDFDMRRKAAALNQKPASANISSQTKPLQSSKAIVLKSAWRRKVNSPIVEDAIDQFTRHLVSEWVTDLWYSRITPDRQGPEELVQIINGVLGELASRMRNINLIDFMTRDIITLICTHLELFRISQTKIEKQQLGLQSTERWDKELKYVLAAENKLHPALFSADAEHKVLQHLMDGLISFTFRPEDLKCSLFRYIVRELLACTVIRPVLNLASPRFVNERIESLVISSKNKANRRATTVQVASQSSPNGSLKISTDHFSRFIDPSVKGVELVQLKKDQSKIAADSVNGTILSKDPLLSIDTRSTRSWNSLLSDSQTGNSGNIKKHPSGGEWGDKLDSISRKKTEALAAEHLENMWTKGRDYRKKGADQFNGPVSQSSSARTSTSVNSSKALSGHKEKNGATKINPDSSSVHSQSGPSYVNHDEFEDVESESTSSYTTDDEEPSGITGLDSPGTKVWDGKSNRNVSLSHIHHPLESAEGHKTRKTNKVRPQTQRLPVTVYRRKRSRLSNQKVHVWQEVDRTSFLSGDGQDILHSSKQNSKLEDSSEDSETEMLGRIRSGATASSSAPSISIPESHSLDVNASKNSLLEDSFFKLRCEVLGANIVKSGSETFTVYSISVTDVNNNSWSIKRRFRHFEEIHRRLKEFPEYNLHLPPKHFLSTGLDLPVIQERCNLLDKYLKNLLQLPTISRSIEVWDFLSVDSQTYVFSNSISIIETLSDNSPRERNTEVHNTARPVVDALSSEKGNSRAKSKESPLQTKGNDVVANGSGLDTKPVFHPPPKKPAKEPGKQLGDSGHDSENYVQTNISSVRNSLKTKKVGEDDGLKASSDSLIYDATDPTLPTEPDPTFLTDQTPNLSVPVFDLVDVIFQLQDGGWIRRKAFWVAKQVLQLGMGDAFDDWLIEKIQLLRRGSVVASGIRRVEQILWPDGIFITKHPKRQRPAPSGNPSQSSPHGRPSSPMSSPNTEDIQKLDEQQKEAERRAKFVYEVMIDNAPAAIVGLVGRKEYEQCAKDLYYFLQSSVCLKQLAFDLLELLLLSAIPEMDYVFRQLNEEKDRFGEFKPE